MDAGQKVLVAGNETVSAPEVIHPLRVYWEYLSYLFRRQDPASPQEQLEMSYRDYLQVRNSGVFWCFVWEVFKGLLLGLFAFFTSQDQVFYSPSLEQLSTSSKQHASCEEACFDPPHHSPAVNPPPPEDLNSESAACSNPNCFTSTPNDP